MEETEEWKIAQPVRWYQRGEVYKDGLGSAGLDLWWERVIKKFDQSRGSYSAHKTGQR